MRVVLVALLVAVSQWSWPSLGWAAGPLAVAPNALHHWDSESDGALKRYSADGVTVTLQTRTNGGKVFPVLTVRAPGGATVSLKGVTAWNGRPEAYFGVGRIDPQHRGGDVLFASDSGGAHCCYRVLVLTLVEGKWEAVDLGWVDEGSPDAVTFPSDPVRGDTLPVVVIGDQRFLGVFDPYTGSLMPPRVFEIRHGTPIDLSQSPRYRRLFEQSAKQSLALCLQHTNGGCAAFVAASARLGRFDSAWKTMLANYDQKDNWQTAVCNQAHCPLTTHPFPQALKEFLLRTGYIQQTKL